MIRKAFILALASLFVAETLQAEMVEVKCQVRDRTVSVFVATKSVRKPDEAKSGLSCYAFNFAKDSFFALIGTTGPKVESEALHAELKPMFKAELGTEDFQLGELRPVEMPESSVVVVGDVAARQFLKISTADSLEVLKKHFDEFSRIRYSLVCRDGLFVKDQFTPDDRFTLSPGDVIIVPKGTTFAYGENVRRIAGKE